MKRIWQGVLLLSVAVSAHLGVAQAQNEVEQRASAFKSGHGEAAPAHPAAAAKGGAPAKSGHGKSSAKGHAAADHAEPTAIAPERALEKLMQGNKRYASGKPAHPNSGAKRRAQVARGQHPFAVVVSCADSRVPPEVLFDQGLGDLFVVRSAGHVVDDLALGSIEYAVEHLGVNLVVVLGHERCGAVDATVKGGEAPGHVNSVVQAIKPAVDKVRSKHGDLLCNAVKSNVKQVAEKIKDSGPILSEAFDDGTLTVVGAYYDLDSGVATLTFKPRF
jgi:carbonic anhydrase